MGICSGVFPPSAPVGVKRVKRLISVSLRDLMFSRLMRDRRRSLASTDSTNCDHDLGRSRGSRRVAGGCGSLGTGGAMPALCGGPGGAGLGAKVRVDASVWPGNSLRVEANR